MHVMGFRMHVAGSHQADCGLPSFFFDRKENRIQKGGVLCASREAHGRRMCRVAHVCMYASKVVSISPPFFFFSLTHLPFPHTSVRWEKKGAKDGQ